MHSNAQVMNWQRVINCGIVTEPYSSRNFIIDRQNNKYVFSNYYHHITIDSITISTNNRGLYLAKYSPNDSLLWLKNLAEYHLIPNSCLAVADSFNNVVFSIPFRDSIKILGTNYFSSGLYDDIIIKVDSNANIIFSRHLASEYSEVIGPNGLKVDNKGNVYLSGKYGYADTLENNPKTLMFDSISLYTTSANFFIAKLDSNNHFIWAKTGTGPGAKLGYSIAVDKKGNSYITGYLTNNLNNYFDSVVLNFPSIFGSQCFLVKYSPDGNALWARYFGIKNFSSTLAPMDINVCGSQVVFCGQGHTNTHVEYTFEGGGIVAGTGGWDSFIAGYDTSGNFKWSKVFQSIGDENMLRLSSNQQDKLYAIGNFNYRMFIDNDTIYTNSYDNLYVTCLDTTGQHQWTLTAGGTQSDLGNDIALDNNGAVYVVGATSSDPCYFGALEFPKTNAFSTFLAKISDEPLQNSTVELKKKFTLYPNPTSGHFILQTDAKHIRQINVYSVIGEHVFTMTNPSQQESIPIQLPSLPDGLYVLKASSDEGNFTQSFLVQTK
jgi:hypothetical protein